MLPPWRCIFSGLAFTKLLLSLFIYILLRVQGQAVSQLYPVSIVQSAQKHQVAAHVQAVKKLMYVFRHKARKTLKSHYKALECDLGNSSSIAAASRATLLSWSAGSFVTELTQSPPGRSPPGF